MANTILRPYLHVNYIDEYLRKIFNDYSVMAPKCFCTYYRFDIEHSVIDTREYVQSGSYTLIGPNSGRVWKKIQLVPLWQAEGPGPIQYNAKEEGVVREITATFLLPDYIGIRPTPQDFITISDGVGTKPEDMKLWIITNHSDSHTGKRKVYKLDCKNEQDFLPTLNRPEHVISEWVYINHLRKIYTYESATTILKSLSTNFSLFDNINKNEQCKFKYDSNICMFTVRP